MTRTYKGIVIFLLGALCLWSYPGAPQTSFAAQQNKKTTRKTPTPSPAQAKSLYAQNCARCHGLDGRGQTDLGALYGASDLSDPKRLSRQSDKRLASVIMNGRAGMPAFSKKLSKEEVASLVAFVRTLRN